MPPIQASLSNVLLLELELDVLEDGIPECKGAIDALVEVGTLLLGAEEDGAAEAFSASDNLRVSSVRSSVRLSEADDSNGSAES